MGKLQDTRTKSDSTKQGVRVRMESKKLVKKVCQSNRKRILMLRRRISILLEEKETWEAKNLEIINNLNTEKKLNAELQKDVFNWQRLYHEALISQNTYKVKNAEIVQNVSQCLKEMKTGVYPHLVGLSDTICRSQLRLTNLLNASNTFETDITLPRTFRDGSDLSKKNEKRMKHVGPMVKGVLIQKPTILLKRVMLQQPQEQEPTNNISSPEGENALTPIAEENEQESFQDQHLEQISMRRKRKHRLGTGERWRMRKQQEQMEKERKKERESQRHSVTESSDSEDQLGPVLRLKRISGLLLSPNLLDVERGRTSEGKGSMSRSAQPESLCMRPGEDPKEGCSWMHVNLVPPKKNSVEKINQPNSDPSSSSESSDEESNSSNVVPNNVRNSVTDSLCKNQTFTMKRKTSFNSSLDITSDSSKVEPDSTNNIEDNTVFVDKSDSNTRSLNTSVVLSKTIQEVELGGSVSNRSNSVAADIARTSQNRRRSSSFCNNCTPIMSPSPIVEGKRVRKPKIQLYPGEEPGSSLTVSKVKEKLGKTLANNKVSLGRTSIKEKTKGKRSKDSSESTSTNATDRKSSQGRTNGAHKKKKIEEKITKRSIKKPSLENSGLRPSSDLSQNLISEGSEGRNSRRIKTPVSYKEPPVNVKMRRPK